MRARTIAFCAAACAFSACGPSAPNHNGGDDDGSPDANNGGGGGGGGGTVDAAGCSKMDLLFVIDNSGSMGQEQANLIANFPTFISVLDASGLDYRVAVTTTGRNYTYNMATPIGNIPESQTGGDNGTMLKPASCNMTKRWIDKNDPNPSMTFSCLANVGTGGPSDEMPLGAVRDAFEDRMADGTNMGFRRSDALLGVVILTDEEDCSYEHSVNLSFSESLCENQMEPVANYKSFLDTYAGGPTRWATAIIAGKGPGACSSSFGDAQEATRLVQFKGLVGTNAIMSSICDGDLSLGLQDALNLFHSACDAIIL
ncbi:MAG TPA: vWA domain-containing protein [Kofleriaceae bacterium]|nr:vWA domain-containing protein [Kofleriaceae bacterium]